MDDVRLCGAELDAWVALAQGHRAVRVMDGGGGRHECRSLLPDATQAQRYSPSTDRALAGPIIESERIGLRDMEAARAELRGHAAP